MTVDVRSAAGRLVSDELVVVPVRHHSPASARAVAQAFDQRRPSRVLIEGPRGSTHLLPLLSHPDARFPLAIYTFARFGAAAAGELAPVAGAYYPFCDHSPELAAARMAHDRAVPVDFIDLDLADQTVLADHSPGPDPGAVSLLDEHHLEHSRRLQRLAGQLGCRDQEELWELLFESDAVEPDLPEYVARMSAYCLLARRDRTPDDLALDGTSAREAEMTWHVAQALSARAAGDGPVLVVLGGFHAVALPDLLAAPPPRPTVELGAVEAGTALIRYADDRLDALNGYAAGMTSPGWHHRIWADRQRGLGPAEARTAAALTCLLDLAATLREQRHPVATPSLVSTHQQLLLLAGLRRRPGPLRNDLVDAVTSCLVQGDADVEGARVLGILREVLRGDRVGRVPPGAGTPPLVGDTLDRLRKRRLSVDDGEPRTLNLDLYRRGEHRVTSRILHGLELLGVPFARKEAGPDFVRGTGLARLQERWSYAWTPASEGALVEASRWGSVLPEAVATAYEHRLAAVTADEAAVPVVLATSLLAQAAVLGLHERAQQAVSVVEDALGREAGFDAVTRATSHLALLWEGREPLEAQRLAGLATLVRTAYDRAIFLGRELQGEECEPEEAAGALSRLRELLASGDSGLDPEPFWEMVERLRTTHDRALVRGAAAGLAYAAGRLGGPALAGDVVGHLTGPVSAEEAVGYVRGLLMTAREAVWQESGVVPALDGLLTGWDEDTFVARLPDLRLAFADLTPRETDRVAALVAGLRGTRLGRLFRRDVDQGQVARHLAASQSAAAALRDDGLGEWAS